MGDLILAALEPLVEGAVEGLLLRFCDLILAGWHVLQTPVGF
jgi:hypothetical protein